MTTTSLSRSVAASRLMCSVYGCDSVWHCSIVPAIPDMAVMLYGYGSVSFTWQGNRSDCSLGLVALVLLLTAITRTDTYEAQLQGAS